MKEYTRPEFYVTKFMPNEYIAACLTGERELTFTCVDCGSSITGKFTGTSSNANRIEGYDSVSHESIVYWPEVYNDATGEPTLCAQFSGGSRGCATSDYQHNHAVDPSGNDGCLIYPSGWNMGALSSDQHHHIGEVITINFS